MWDSWRFRLGDFVPYGPDSYWYLFEKINLASWPLQLLFMLPGLALLTMGRLGFVGRRIVFLVLAGIWGWVAWNFFYFHYTAINWVGMYFAYLFGIQALILSGMAAFISRIEIRYTILPIVLMIYGVFLHPLLAVLSGREIVQADILGVGPDATAIVTLGLALSVTKGTWIATIPLLWLGISTIALFANQQPEGWVTATAIVLSAWAIVDQCRKTIPIS